MLVKSRCAWARTLSHDVYSEREAIRSTSTANIAECGHCRGTYIGTGTKGAELGGLRVERRMDLHLSLSSSFLHLLFLLHILFLCLFFFILLFFSHYCSLWPREATASINMFPRAKRATRRKQCYIWHHFVYPISLYVALHIFLRVLTARKVGRVEDGEISMSAGGKNRDNDDNDDNDDIA